MLDFMESSTTPCMVLSAFSSAECGREARRGADHILHGRPEGTPLHWIVAGVPGGLIRVWLWLQNRRQDAGATER
jgi:hypothetical protein